MTTEEPGLDLDSGFERSGMTYDELWIRQVALGGSAGRFEVEAYVIGLLVVDPYQHDLIAHALNEFFMEHGQGPAVRYVHSASTE